MPLARLAPLLLVAGCHALGLPARTVQPRLGRPRAAAARLVVEDPTITEESPTDWTLPVALAGVGLAAAVHAPAFARLASQWAAVSSEVGGDSFWAPAQFWAFFAAMHPLLKPAVWIGEVLHSSPGPQLGELLPVSFLAANAVVISLLVTQPRFRTALNAALVALLINFVGCGLEGSGNLADYNLALDDGVKGCPTYESLRRPSMDGFDIAKYSGRWYEQAFHDWTQFAEVYDTTFDIELSKDGKRWLDDFAVRGPSPAAAPASWEKSPITNGAHYFLYGSIDSADAGVLRESGFGVTFPNFILDVQRDDKGGYSEAIQFQCLERGGVRIFEGINFLTRKPLLTDAEMAGMFARAKEAGLEPYGASPAQMHLVQHRQPGGAEIDNSWQRFWRSLGVDKLLALVESSTHSTFEDTSAMQ